MPRLRINYYEDGEIMDIEKVDKDAEPMQWIDSAVLDVTEEKADKILEALWLLRSLKGLQNS